MARRRNTPDESSVESPKGFDDYDLRLGDIMRGERATMGKSLLDVQRDLKIKAAYINAIENADPTVFESPGFVAGYVRSYARYLKLDPEWAYREFCVEGNFAHEPGSIGQAGKPGGSGGKVAKSGAAKGKRGAPDKPGLRDPFKQPSVSFIPAGESAFSGVEPGAIGSIAVLVALISALGYGGWSVLQEVQKVQFTPVDQTPGVLSELDPVAPTPADESGDPVTVAELQPPSADAFDRLYRPQVLDVPVFVSRDGPIATIDPGSIGVLAPPEPPKPAGPVYADEQTPPLLPLDPSSPDSASGSDVQILAEGPPVIELVAVRPSWVRVRAADGTIVFEKILDAGERFQVPQTEEPHTLRAGNAGSLYFAVGDQTYGPAGTGAGVVKDVIVSAEALPQTYALADPAADADLARFTAVAEAQNN